MAAVDAAGNPSLARPDWASATCETRSKKHGLRACRRLAVADDRQIEVAVGDEAQRSQHSLGDEEDGSRRLRPAQGGRRLVGMMVSVVSAAVPAVASAFERWGRSSGDWGRSRSGN